MNSLRRRCICFSPLLLYVTSFLGVASQPDCFYALRLRQFRVAIIELLCRTLTTTDAEKIEMRFFGVPNAVVRVSRVKDEQNQQNMNGENVSSNNNRNSYVLPQI